MQLITSISKYLLLAVLSISFIIVVFSSNPVVTETNSSEITLNDENAETIVSRTTNVIQSKTTDIVTSATASKIVSTSSNHQSAESVWSSITREFKLDHSTQSAQVQAEIRKLLADQGKLNAILKAAAPYIYFIHEQVEVRGLPAELALIPVIESEFNPNDHSKKGATGLWQLMPGTAHELGVSVKSGYDGRRDVIASTKAALAYFNDLGKLFNGNWYLAIAAYNCGQGKIQSAVKRAGSKSFWKLRLSRETQIYVPKLLAVAAIIQNPEKYGVQLPPITDKPFFTQVDAKKKVDIVKVAKSTGIDPKMMHALNPDYKNGMVQKKKGSYPLLVPVNKAPVVKAQLGVK